eukprot:g52009.t1
MPVEIYQHPFEQSNTLQLAYYDCKSLTQIPDNIADTKSDIWTGLEYKPSTPKIRVNLQPQKSGTQGPQSQNLGLLGAPGVPHANPIVIIYF